MKSLLTKPPVAVLRALVLGLLTTVGAGSSWATVLQPHRAIYDLAAGRVESGSEVEAVAGRFVIEVVHGCDGYILNQRIVTRMSRAGGEELVNDFRVAFWESHDGLRFRFNLQNFIDGRLIEEEDGRAQISGPNGFGTAEFRKPEAARLDLPAGTMFPMAHNQKVLRLAEAGESEFQALLFDGSRTDGLYNTFTHIGRPRTGRQDSHYPALAGKRSWPVRMAYFPVTAREAVPEFEIGFTLFDNGVARSLKLDYGSFEIEGQLSALEMLQVADCGG